jgi:hypothetical protein
MNLLFLLLVNRNEQLLKISKGQTIILLLYNLSKASLFTLSRRQINYKVSLFLLH